MYHFNNQPFQIFALSDFLTLLFYITLDCECLLKLHSSCQKSVKHPPPTCVTSSVNNPQRFGIVHNFSQRSISFEVCGTFVKAICYASQEQRQFKGETLRTGQKYEYVVCIHRCLCSMPQTVFVLLG